uniref:Uncharacterized protein n=1 Tax=Phytophthora ramorum TaxID=164328 RepID=H3H1C3_PHYRM
MGVLSAGLYAQLGGAIGLQIEGVLFSKDFVSVTKTEDERWGALNAAIITDTTILPEDAEVVAMTKEPLEQRIRLSVQDGGGNIFHQGLAGSCPSSPVAFKHGVEGMLKHYTPEARGIEKWVDEEDTRSGQECK